jgi:starch synthase
MILLSHPTGNEFSRNAALAMAEAHLLKEFWTTISWSDTRRLNRLLPLTVRSELQRRSFPAAVEKLTKTFPAREIGRLLARRMGLSYLIRHEHGLFSVDAVYKSIDRRVAKRLSRLSGLDAVYAYEDAALETFRKAREYGLKCIYDLPIGYWRAGQEIYKEEAGLQPEWAATLQGNADSKDKLARKDAELTLANTIIVPSNFVKETLRRAPELSASITVVPFGAPPVTSAPERRASRQKLRVLYVGSLTQRKGLSYLLKAIAGLRGSVEFTIIGNKMPFECRPLDVALSTYRWIPSLPHDKILTEMRSHDILVLPTLFEGFALVILEAMSQGLPVITTPNSGGTEIITDGKNGFIIPIRSAESISEKIRLVDQDRDLLTHMGQEARFTASLNGWDRYRHRIMETIVSHKHS